MNKNQNINYNQWFWFENLKKYTVFLLKEIKNKGLDILTFDMYDGLINLSKLSFTSTQFDYINKKDLSKWDYKTFPIKECRRLEKRFYEICNKYHLEKKRKIYCNMNELKIGKWLQYEDYIDFQKWFDMNKLSYELFDRSNKNLYNQQYYVIHHLFETIQSSLSETSWLIDIENFKYQEKENIIIVDDFIHIVIHLLLMKLYSKSFKSVEYSSNIIEDIINNKFDKLFEKKKYLIDTYGMDNLFLLKQVIDKINSKKQIFYIKL